MLVLNPPDGGSCVVQAEKVILRVRVRSELSMGLAKIPIGLDLEKRVLPSDDIRGGALRCIQVDVVREVSMGVILFYTALDALDRHVSVCEWRGAGGSELW